MTIICATVQNFSSLFCLSWFMVLKVALNTINHLKFKPLKCNINVVKPVHALTSIKQTPAVLISHPFLFLS